VADNRKVKRKQARPDNLLEWQEWLEEELAPPPSDVVGTKPELKRVLEAFLRLVIHVRQMHARSLSRRH
jgi:hypothetical protein